MIENPWIFFVAALIPILLGAIWYNPAVLGRRWMKLAMISEEQLQSGRFPVILLVTYIFSLMLSFMLYTIVVHQAHIGSLFMGFDGYQEQMTAESGELFERYTAMMSQFEGMFRTFKHGMLHGAIAGLFIAMPVLGINALFERKKAGYILLNTLYWMIALMLMGGLVCAYA